MFWLIYVFLSNSTLMQLSIFFFLSFNRQNAQTDPFSQNIVQHNYKICQKKHAKSRKLFDRYPKNTDPKAHLWVHTVKNVVETPHKE